MTSHLLLFIAMIGCRSGSVSDQGTVVGNPGDNAMRVAEGNDLALVSARTTVDTMAWSGCDGDVEVIELAQEFDLLANHAFEMPLGTWCDVTIVFSDSLSVEATGIDEADDTTITLDLNVESASLHANGGFVIANSRHVLELGYPGWLDAEELSDEDASAKDAALIDIVSNRSALFADENNDGNISDEERETGPVASGDDRTSDDDASDEECDRLEELMEELEEECGDGDADACEELEEAWEAYLDECDDDEDDDDWDEDEDEHDTGTER